MDVTRRVLVDQDDVWTPPDGRSIEDWTACRGLSCDEYVRVQQILEEVRLIDYETKWSHARQPPSITDINKLVSDT